MTEVLDVLIAARAEVEKGWCKFSFEDDGGRVCAQGALDRVGAYGRTPVRDALIDALPPDYVPPKFRNIGLMLFNDTHTQADVLALFDRAIAAEAVKVSPDPAHTYTTAA
jgi:hypothetical protein